MGSQAVMGEELSLVLNFLSLLLPLAPTPSLPPYTDPNEMVEATTGRRCSECTVYVWGFELTFILSFEHLRWRYPKPLNE